ncbi:SusF/SusE family outer membrane protein [Limibacterium fermenti]|uniref:SusF/SusE family outer membrane protein n=1 Tax=Limibacterium fermenti TaxID=3229863 RepID=UPI000E9DB196|nr:hypothetical protein [Porphyromonadaceae bacterium]
MMKKTYSLLIVLICLGCFWACQEDDQTVLQQPESFVLNTPKYVSGVYDLKNTETLEFTCTQPDYGFTAVAIYSVQVSLTEDFSEYKTLPGTHTTAKIEVKGSDFAVALVELLKIEEESQYPTDLQPVYVRLSSVLTDDGIGKVYSNVITLPKVKGYFALEPMVMPENIYLAGNITDNWNWNKATEMVPVHSAEGKFWAIQYLGKTSENADAQIKFNTVKAGDAAFGSNDITIDEKSVDLAGITTNDDGNIVIGTPGWYIVVVTTTINGRSYEYAVEFHAPYVYLQGDINGGNWGTTDAAYRFTVPDLSAGASAEFVSPAFTAPSGDGGVRASIVLEGYDWWKTEFIVLNNKLEYRGAGEDQDRVAGKTGQKLYINFTAKTGKIE